MGFTQSKDLDWYEEVRQNMGYEKSKDLKLYDDTKKKEGKSRVSIKVKISIFMKK